MNNKYPWTQAMSTGVIIGVFVLSFFSFFNLLNKYFAWGMSPMTIRGLSGLVTLIILAVGIYMGMQAIKKQNGGTLSYKQAFFSGVVVALTTGVIVAFCAFIYCQFINPGLPDYLLSESKKIMISQGKSAADADIATELASLRKQLTTSAQVFEAFVGQSIGGTLMSAIMGLFLRTKNK
jgi:hypothetical protein